MLGAAWYPEQWPEARWEADLALMERDDRWVAVAVVADRLTDPEDLGGPDHGTAVLPLFATIGELAAERLRPVG